MRGNLQSLEEIISEKDKNLNMKNDEIRKLTDQISAANIVNVLLLGQTGIGKTTFINSLANYMLHESLDAALKTETKVLIPCKIKIHDQNGEPKTLDIKNSLLDEGEKNFKDGVSSTQNVKSYVIYCPSLNRKIRILDTPGIADTRGREKDSENMKDIINALNELKTLSAVIFLLKPNEDRHTATFRYCLSEVLNALPKGFAKHILFCTTHSRTTFYTLGETHGPLTQLIRDLNIEDDISLIPGKNVFAVDNEAFRYLIAHKNDQHTYFEKYYHSFAQSWKISVDSMMNMFKIIMDLQPKGTQIIVDLQMSYDSIQRMCQQLTEMHRQLTEITQTMVLLEEWKLEECRSESERLTLLLNENNKIVKESKKSIAEITKATSKLAYNYRKNCLVDITKTDYVEHYVTYRMKRAEMEGNANQVELFKKHIEAHKKEIEILKKEFDRAGSMKIAEQFPAQILNELKQNQNLSGTVFF